MLEKLSCFRGNDILYRFAKDTLRLITLAACELLDTCSYCEYYFFSLCNTVFLLIFECLPSHKEYHLGVYSLERVSFRGILRVSFWGILFSKSMRQGYTQFFLHGEKVGHFRFKAFGKQGIDFPECFWFFHGLEDFLSEAFSPYLLTSHSSQTGSSI